MGGEGEGESLGEGGVALSVFPSSFLSSLHRIPTVQGMLVKFIGPYSLSLVYQKLLNVSICEPHNYVSSAQWIVFCFLKVHV